MVQTTSDNLVPLVVDYTMHPEAAEKLDRFSGLKPHRVISALADASLAFERTLWADLLPEHRTAEQIAREVFREDVVVDYYALARKSCDLVRGSPTIQFHVESWGRGTVSLALCLNAARWLPDEELFAPVNYTVPEFMFPVVTDSALFKPDYHMSIGTLFHLPGDIYQATQVILQDNHDNPFAQRVREFARKRAVLAARCAIALTTIECVLLRFDDAASVAALLPALVTCEGSDGIARGADDAVRLLAAEANKLLALGFAFGPTRLPSRRDLELFELTSVLTYNPFNTLSFDLVDLCKLAFDCQTLHRVGHALCRRNPVF